MTKQRVLAEARVLVKLSGLRSKGVYAPAVLALEWDTSRSVKHFAGDKVRDGGEGGAWLLMEWIEGKSTKDLLREWDAWYRSAGVTDEAKQKGKEEVKKLLRKIGRAVGVLHSEGGVVHGDLTSSNIMIRPSEEHLELKNGVHGVHNEAQEMPSLQGAIVLIDFGLTTQSIQDEDRAVDLYVLERAFGSTHPRQEAWFDQEVLQSGDGDRGAFKGSQVVLKRLDEVRLRGRKRSMVG